MCPGRGGKPASAAKKPAGKESKEKAPRRLRATRKVDFGPESEEDDDDDEAVPEAKPKKGPKGRSSNAKLLQGMIQKLNEPDGDSSEDEDKDRWELGWLKAKN